MLYYKTEATYEVFIRMAKKIVFYTCLELFVMIMYEFYTKVKVTLKHPLKLYLREPCI